MPPLPGPIVDALLIATLGSVHEKFDVWTGPKSFFRIENGIFTSLWLAGHR